MSIYARIQNGTIQELFTPPAGTTLAQCFHPDVAAQFVDVTTVTPAPQPNWTAVETGGTWTFAAPVVPVPTNAQLAQAAYDAAVAAGVQVTSTGTPALNGTYALDQTTLGRITAEQVYIATAGKFTNGSTTRAWLDAAGAPHTFPSTAAFTAFAEAVAQYDDALIAALDTGLAGGAWVAPAQPAAIL